VEAGEDPEATGRRQRLHALGGRLGEPVIVEEPVDVGLFAAMRHVCPIIAEQMLSYAVMRIQLIA
jgi:hypothetical protein